MLTPNLTPSPETAAEVIRRINGQHYALAYSDYFQKMLDGSPREHWPVVEKAIEHMVSIQPFGYRPLPQAEAFHKSHKRFRWALGGNRSSKSHSVALEVFWFATCLHPFRNVGGPNTGWYSTITWELVGTILWEKMEMLLADTPHEVLWRNRASNIPNSVKLEIPGQGESKIIFKAYEQGREIFQGVERRYVANDEQFSQSIFHEQISRIGPGVPMDFFAALTPLKPQAWLEERLTNEVPSTWDVFEYPLDDNRVSRGGFIPDADIDMLIDEWPIEVQPTRRSGKWGSFVGAIYKTFDKKVHVVPESEEHKYFPTGKPPQSVLPIGGIDFGGANPFVFLWGIQLPHLDGEWYIFDEYYWNYKEQGVRLMAHHAADILKRTRETWKTELLRTWADHDRQDRYELEHGGVNTLPANKEWISGIETIQTHLKVRDNTGRPRLHIAARCKNLIREISTLQWPPGTDTRDPSDVGQVKLNDHAPDALRYMIHSQIGGSIRSAEPPKLKGNRRRY